MGDSQKWAVGHGQAHSPCRWANHKAWSGIHCFLLDTSNKSGMTIRTLFPVSKSCRNKSFKSCSKNGFQAIFTPISLSFNHGGKGNWQDSFWGLLVKCVVHYTTKFLFIILHFCINVHRRLAVFMPGKILDGFWINASVQKVGNIGVAQLMC